MHRNLILRVQRSCFMLCDRNMNTKHHQLNGPFQQIDAVSIEEANTNEIQLLIGAQFKEIQKWLKCVLKSALKSAIIVRNQIKGWFG